MRSCTEEVTLLACAEDQVAAQHIEVCLKWLWFPLPPFPNQNRNSAVSQWLLLCSARLQLETSSDATKGLKSPGTDQCDWLGCFYQLCWHHSLSSWQKEETATTSLRVGRRHQLLRVPGLWMMLHWSPPFSTATQNCSWQADKTPNPTENVILSEESFTFSAKKEQTLSQSALNLIRHVIFSFYRWKCH